MSPNAFVEWIINKTIMVFFYWLTHNFYIFIVFVMNIGGITGILFDFEFAGSDWLHYGMLWILFFAGIFLWLVFSVLSWIFVFWMSIIMFVPFVLIIPIPIIPFIIPIPLKLVILEYVPPFKLLTDRGVLPYIRKVIFRFLFSEDKIKKKFTNTLEDTYGFLYEELKIILGDLFKNVMTEPEPVVISKDLQDDDHTIDISKEGQEETKTQKEADASPENRRIQELIDEELKVCLRTKQSFTLSDTSSVGSLYSSMPSMDAYSTCYASSIKSYIDNKL